VTMRTPGDDVELAIGYCITEGLIRGHDDVQAVRAGGAVGGADEYNTLSVDLRPGVPVPDPGLDRLHVTSSSCGVCGKASVDAVRVRCQPVSDDLVVVGAPALAAVPGRVRAAQRLFDRTGGLHAAALVGAGGELCCVREDIGRHNAVDQAVGGAAPQGRPPLAGSTLV